MTTNRPTWHETWMSVAEIIAERSHDKRMKVGCVIVTEDNTQVLSVGYNGNFKGGPHEPESLEPGKSAFIHAEVNSLLKLDFNNPKNKIMYITLSPCRMCAKCIVNAGVKRVVYHQAYRDPSGIQLLQDAGVDAVSLSDLLKS